MTRMYSCKDCGCFHSFPEGIEYDPKKVDCPLCGSLNNEIVKDNMKIEVFENGSKSKLIAVLVDDDGQRELVRTDKGRDDLLNQIDRMNLSHLTVRFN